MDEKEIELMEQIIDMLGGAGESTFWLVMAWVGQGYFVPIVTGVTITGLAVIASGVIRYFTNDPWNKLREEAGCVCPYGEVTKQERDRVYNMIRKGVEAEKKEKSDD